MSEKVGAPAVAAVVAMMMLFLHSDVAEGTNYVVGKKVGDVWYYHWTTIYHGNTYLPRGLKLKAGDTLEFIYNNYHHNVAKVDETGYNKCDGTRANTTTYKSGDDKIALESGMNYFICTIFDYPVGKGNCRDYKMKLAVYAK